MMRLSMGYPVQAAETQLYHQGDRRRLLPKIQAVASPQILLQWQQQAAAQTVSEAVAAYVYRLVSATRRPGVFALGLSPRAGLAVIKAAKAWSLLEGRNFVLPEDVKAVWVSVANHRLQTLHRQNSADALAEMLDHVAV